MCYPSFSVSVYIKKNIYIYIYILNKCKAGVGRLELSKGIPVDVPGMLVLSSSSRQFCHVGWCSILEDLADASRFPKLLPEPSPPQLNPETRCRDSKCNSRFD